jgi:hypothetical protein
MASTEMGRVVAGCTVHLAIYGWEREGWESDVNKAEGDVICNLSLIQAI